MREEILSSVIDEFRALAAIPRPSGHEKAVSDYLKERLLSLGGKVEQDKNYNIIADFPASDDCSNAPLTILQAHMDMVCVADSGVKYNPLQDAIKLVIDKEFISADGTSLGGDDGIGIAVILVTISRLRNKSRGAIRILITVDEEMGMTGARELSDKYFKDANYLINCDSEDYNTLTVSSAGGVSLDFFQSIEFSPISSNNIWQIKVTGLKGGHSGDSINKGRGNAIKTLAIILKRILSHSKLEIISINGGEARNAIPREANAIIATDVSEKKLQDIISVELDNFKATYGDYDNDISINIKSIEIANNTQALDAKITNNLIDLLLILHTGVFAVSQISKGFVETSANIGVVEMNDKEIMVRYFPRSSSNERLDEFILTTQALASLTGFNLAVGGKYPGWREMPNGKLANIITKVFYRHNGYHMIVESIHAGLECGWYLAKNPNLDMVSIGVTAFDIHTPQERIKLATIAPEVLLLEETLLEIAKI